MKYLAVSATVVGLIVVGLLLITVSPRLPLSAPPPLRASPSPPTDAVFTSTRYVTRLAVAPDGALWVGTMGGVLRRSEDGTWQKGTRLDGLPAHEVRGLLIDGEEVVAVFPTASAVWRDGAWQVEPTARPLSHAGLSVGAALGGSPLCATVWRGRPCVATVTGLHLSDGQGWRRVALPKSRGTHLSALLPHGETLWAALFGDGLWAFDGKAWQRLDVGLPPSAREITAMASDGRTVWLGTRREGVWEYNGKEWTQHLQPDEPYDHNCQAVATYRGHLFVSTLEDGLVVRTEGGWRHYTDDILSSNAPRQLVEFGNRLYVRHGNGKVDCCEGERWTRDVCSGLPRREATALAADREGWHGGPPREGWHGGPPLLYVAQWGGWSEFDGQTWTHHLGRPELQGVPITVLYPEGDTLWIGTQGRGLAEVVRATGALRWHDERQGLPDDWVKCIARVGQSLYVGTFVGGLARWDGARWAAVAELSQGEVPALSPDGAGGVFIATRTGVWHQARDGSLERAATRDRPYQRADFLDPEVQALCLVEGGLWVGTRTGLYFLSDAREEFSA